MLPPEVLRQAYDELLNWRDTSASVMEISHRSSEFGALIAEIERDCRDLLNLPENYRLLFLGGGARGQFAAIPLNLATPKTQVAYVISGMWSKIASEEAKRYADVQIVASNESNLYQSMIPEQDWLDYNHAAYLHYTENETVHGIEFPIVPASGKVPLICDMSSSILSRPLDVTRYGLIYAGAQKNLGIAGITLIIIRDDLLLRPAQAITPTILNYSVQVKHKSMYNTPATFPWYVMGLIFKWLKKQGGLTAMGELNQRKSAKLYHYIDQSQFYQNPVQPQYRSRMNVIFTLADKEKEPLFLQESKAAGLIGLKGHSSLGGFRASLYNAMTESGVDALIEFMQKFAEKYSSL